MTNLILNYIYNFFILDICVKKEIQRLVLVMLILYIYIYIFHTFDIHSFISVDKTRTKTDGHCLSLSLSLKPIWPSLLLLAWNGSFYDMEEAKARRRLSILCSHLRPLGASDSGHAPTHLISSRLSNSDSETENNKKNLHQNDCVFCKIIINESPSVKVIIQLNFNISFFFFFLVKRKTEVWILRFFTIWVSNFELFYCMRRISWSQILIFHFETS